MYCFFSVIHFPGSTHKCDGVAADLIINPNNTTERTFCNTFVIFSVNYIRTFWTLCRTYAIETSMIASNYPEWQNLMHLWYRSHAAPTWRRRHTNKSRSVIIELPSLYFLLNGLKNSKVSIWKHSGNVSQHWHFSESFLHFFVVFGHFASGGEK